MKKPHYAWAICASGSLLLLCTIGAATNAFSVYLPVIEAQGGFTGAQGSAILTVRCLFTLFAMFFVTGFYEKLGLRRGITLSLLLETVGFVLFAAAGTRLPIYYAGACFTGVAYGLGSMIPVSLLMNRWFACDRALAIGICSAGTGLASICLPPVITRLLEHTSLARTLLVESAFLAVCTAVIFLVVRDHPAQLGLRPYGEDRPSQSGTGAQGKDLPRGVDLAVTAGMALMAAASTAGTAHYPLLLTTNGFTAAQAAAGLSLMGACLMAGKFLYGGACDRLGGKKASLLFFAGMAAANLLCWQMTALAPWRLPLAMVCSGLGYPPATVGISVWAADFSDAGNFARTLRRYQIGYAIGGLLFSSVPGIWYDYTGSYRGTYLLLFFFALAVAAILAAAYRAAEQAQQKPDLAGSSG